MTQQLVPLSYAKAGLARRWRRLIKWSVVTLVLSASSYFAWRFIGHDYWERLNRYNAQVAALAHQPGSGWVAHTEIDTTSSLPKEQQLPGFSQSQSNRNVPGPWWDLWIHCGVNAPNLLYLGSRQSPSGNQRLVAVSNYKGPKGWQKEEPPYLTVETWTLVLSASVLEPATRTKPPQMLSYAAQAIGILVPKSGRLEVFAGAPDSVAPSRFTLQVRDGDFVETIDGWLQDDDTIRLVPRTAKRVKLLSM